MNKSGPLSVHRMLLFLRHAICRPAPLAAWLGLSLSFAVFAALTGASIRLMLSAGSKADGLAVLAGMGPSVAGTVMPLSEPVAIVATLLVIRILTSAATAVPLLLIEPKRTWLFLTLCADIAITGVVATAVGGVVSTGVFRLILGPVVPERDWPSPLPVSLLLCLPVALILTARMLIAASLCVTFDSIGKGAAAYIALYYLPPIVVANLPDLRMPHEWLPSIAGTAVVETRPAINPILSGAIALAYVVIAVAVAVVSLNRRDVG